jgi:uncharacterized glyoxalase superfamily protein PhnB
VTPTSLGAVGNVFAFVADLLAATQWYRDRLGCEPVLTDRRVVAFDIAGTRLTLHVADEYNSPGPSVLAVYWTVRDVDRVVAAWTEAGATVHRGPKTVFTGERLRQLRDPFGNLFCVRQEVGDHP